MGQLQLSQAPAQPPPSFIQTSLTGVVLGGLTAGFLSFLMGRNKTFWEDSAFGGGAGFIVGAIVPRLY